MTYCLAHQSYFSRQKRPHSHGLFGKESIRKRNLLYVLCAHIPGNFRIDKKLHRHFNTLPRLEPLFRKAKTLDLAKITTRHFRRNIIARRSNNRLIG